MSERLEPKDKNVSRRSIAAEIKRMGGPEAFNNFFAKLPEGVEREWYMQHLPSDVTFGEQLKRMGGSSKESQFSEKYLSITPRQWFTTIDTAIKKLNLGPVLRKINSQFLDADERRRRINKAIVPLYTELRLMGFEPHDIWGVDKLKFPVKIVLNLITL